MKNQQAQEELAVIFIRVPPQLKTDFEEAARREHRNLTGQLKKIMEDFVRQSKVVASEVKNGATA